MPSVSNFSVQSLERSAQSAFKSAELRWEVYMYKNEPSLEQHIRIFVTTSAHFLEVGL